LGLFEDSRLRGLNKVTVAENTDFLFGRLSFFVSCDELIDRLAFLVGIENDIYVEQVNLPFS